MDFNSNVCRFMSNLKIIKYALRWIYFLREQSSHLIYFKFNDQIISIHSERDFKKHVLEIIYY